MFGRVSHTQYEALYARQLGKNVWFILLDETFSTDPHDAEADDRRELQRAYRDIVRAKCHDCRRAATSVELKKLILGLEDDLPGLRRGFSVRAVLVIVLAACLALLLIFQRQPKKHPAAGFSRSTLGIHETGSTIGRICNT